MEHRLYIVTGAPSAGESATCDAFLALHTPYVAFDMDWLVPAVSALACSSILHDPATWRPYRALWFEVLRAITRNGNVPVLFAPMDREDAAGTGPPDWCDGIAWLLLDCDDRTRRERLTQRAGWTTAMVADAVADAAALRAAFSARIDTAIHTPDAVASRIRAWLGRQRES
jgi:hypothetical protein